MITFTFENETETIKFVNISNPELRKEEIERLELVGQILDLWDIECDGDYTIVDAEGEEISSDYIAVDLNRVEK